MSDLRERVQQITAEYWEVREEQSERVAVAQMALALARAEARAASVPPPPPLDVERVKSALLREGLIQPIDPEYPHAYNDQAAQRITEELLALAAETPEPTE